MNDRRPTVAVREGGAGFGVRDPFPSQLKPHKACRWSPATLAPSRPPIHVVPDPEASPTLPHRGGSGASRALARNLFHLEGIQPPVDAVMRDELVMSPYLGNPSFVDHDDT